MCSPMSFAATALYNVNAMSVTVWNAGECFTATELSTIIPLNTVVLYNLVGLKYWV
jgi:hypothetical protein